ncbi:cytokinin-regulated kinase 1 [Striga asiatica]|uniref:Cytokinin-regulated kinase 1 n=1 Tax=Striga asiatica TaxID=4170 RepID=A0A5A7PY87_STRAF|nr:cytokinin-regulated kinase 1 [Striga asiatica]
MAKNPSFPVLALFLAALFFPNTHSLSTFAVSETGNRTVVCAVAGSLNQQSLNCTIFPQRVQFPISPSLPSVAGVVAGDGFICAVSPFNSSSSSVVVCWRFSDLGGNLTYRRIYNGPALRDFASGNSQICGLVNSSNSLQCWPQRIFNNTVDNSNNADSFSSSLAVGENFVCGLLSSGRVQCLGSAYNVTDEMPVGNFSQVRAGPQHACAVSLNGSLLCWGNTVGPIPRPEGEFTSVALGESRACAIRSNRMVVCWGENGFALPDSLRAESFISLEAKRTIFCGVVFSNYSLLCWGNAGFDPNPLVFSDVVPGPCRARVECGCEPLPNYGQYCDQGLVICQPCVNINNQSQLIPPPPPPPPPVAAPPPPPPSGGRKWNAKMVAFLVIGCVGSFSSLLLVCIYLFSRYIKISGSRIHDSGRLEAGGSSPHTPESQPEPPPARPPSLEKKVSHLISMGSGGHLEEFPLETLLAATDNFSDERKIGSGSFGSVYCATLDDGREVAVKRAETSRSSSSTGPGPGLARHGGPEDKDSAFLNELEFLSRLNHRNLVRLLGYCEERDERVLVYEYMPNGTLADHVHELPDSPLRSWPARIRAGLDAARGIEYLHEYAVPRVIHRDIKPSNILLDGSWTARVSDFGLSLTGPRDGESHLSMGAAGTMGYVDPAYYRLQVLTAKSDVYSFGVVLMELLSGLKAVHKNEGGVPRNVVDYVLPFVGKDEIHRVLDRRIPPPTPFEIEAVAYVGCLAADCVELDGRDRPTMSEVVEGLERALEACLAPPVMSRSTTSSS